MITIDRNDEMSNLPEDSYYMAPEKALRALISEPPPNEETPFTVYCRFYKPTDLIEELNKALAGFSKKPILIGPGVYEIKRIKSIT
jgi:hypothetical protein